MISILFHQEAPVHPKPFALHTQPSRLLRRFVSISGLIAIAVLLYLISQVLEPVPGKGIFYKNCGPGLCYRSGFIKEVLFLL